MCLAATTTSAVQLVCGVQIELDQPLKSFYKNAIYANEPICFDVIYRLDSPHDNFT